MNEGEIIRLDARLCHRCQRMQFEKLGNRVYTYSDVQFSAGRLLSVFSLFFGI
jgi:hypothetical protein